VKVIKDKDERSIPASDLVDDDIQQGLECGWLRSLEDA
jgi:hypothetical protein